jgi:hypothetical protein
MNNLQTGIMHLKQIMRYAIPLLFVLITGSCTQDEGYGGTGHIKGELIYRYYNEDFTVFQGEEPAKSEDVFLLFKDDKNIGDDVETSYTGNFQFSYLWPGSYKLYYLSDDTTKQSFDSKEITVDIKLDLGQTLDLGKLYAYKGLKWNDGTAKIKGRIMVVNYKNTPTFPKTDTKDTTLAQEQEVYIIYNNEDFYSDRIRTQEDGTYVFPNLLIGSYTVYVYSENIYTNSTNKLVKKLEVEITEKGQVLTLNDIIIDKL